MPKITPTSGLLDEVAGHGAVTSAPPDRVCGDCGRMFKRAADRKRHQDARTCRDKIKKACPVCRKALNPRKDALRRHQLRTGACVQVQDETPRDVLAAAGCVTIEEREADARRQQERGKGAAPPSEDLL